MGTKYNCDKEDYWTSDNEDNKEEALAFDYDDNDDTNDESGEEIVVSLIFIYILNDKLSHCLIIRLLSSLFTYH